VTLPATNTLALLQLCDSLFPTGAFAHSDGLETATAEGRVATAADVGVWMDTTLDDTLGRLEGPALLLAWGAWNDERWCDIADLDAEVHALRPSASGRTASRAIGSRLLMSWQRIRPTDRLDRFVAAHGNARLTLPVAFGGVCATEGIDGRTALDGFFYTRLAGVISAAMRLMPLGQGEAHALLADTLGRVPAAIEAVLTADARPMTFAPAVDIAAMRHQFVPSRLFRS
jgi:urease accessory protein